MVDETLEEPDEAFYKNSGSCLLKLCRSKLLIDSHEFGTKVGDSGENGGGIFRILCNQTIAQFRFSPLFSIKGSNSCSTAGLPCHFPHSTQCFKF